MPTFFLVKSEYWSLKDVSCFAYRGGCRSWWACSSHHPVPFAIASSLRSSYHFLLLYMLPVLYQFHLLSALWFCWLSFNTESHEAPSIVSWCFNLASPIANKPLCSNERAGLTGYFHFWLMSFCNDPSRALTTAVICSISTEITGILLRVLQKGIAC